MSFVSLVTMRITYQIVMGVGSTKDMRLLVLVMQLVHVDNRIVGMIVRYVGIKMGGMIVCMRKLFLTQTQ